MKICVLGAGVVGTTAAWMLAESGHEVTVLERKRRVADATSHANASLLTPGHSLAWNSPQAPYQFLKSLLTRDPVMAIRLKALIRSFPWIMRFLQNCHPRTVSRVNKTLIDLTLESTRKTAAMAAELGVDISLGAKGLLYWHSEPADLEADRRHCEWINEQGVSARILSPLEVLETQPALARRRKPVVGGLKVEEDRVADARALCQHLSSRLLAAGHPIHCCQDVIGLKTVQGRVTAVITEEGEVEADAIVLALGPWSGDLLKTLGIHFPLNPAKGYSMTLSLKEGMNPPGISGMDASELVTFAMLGNRLRVTSYAHFEGFDLSTPEGRFARHRRAVDDNFPGLVDWTAETKKWCGLRPMSPDGLPTIDRVPGLQNCWVNAGHGYLGWTLAVKSAEILKDRINGDERATPQGLQWRWS